MWSPLTVSWKNEAAKDLRRLSRKDQEQIYLAVAIFASTGVGDVRPLVGIPGYRIRVRNRRIFVEIEWIQASLTVTAVKKRGDAY